MRRETSERGREKRGRGRGRENKREREERKLHSFIPIHSQALLF